MVLVIGVALVAALVIRQSSTAEAARRLALVATVWAKPWMGLTVALFVVAAAGLKAYLPAFWSMPSLFLTEAAAAGSIGLINSVGNLGGFFGPTVVGWLTDRFGGFAAGVGFLAAVQLIAIAIALALQPRQELKKAGLKGA